MRKIIIHTEEIKKRGAKQQFQIKLPSTTNMVVGILITANPVGNIGRFPQEGEERPIPIPIRRETERGWIWMRIPENRDVFYANTLQFPDHLKQDNQGTDGIDQEGLDHQPEWWFSGTKREFFEVTVPIEDTIIEGFYVDRSAESNVDYEVKVYLELELDRPVVKCGSSHE